MNRLSTLICSFALASVVSHAAYAVPTYISPGTIAQIQQQGGTVTVTGDKIVINMPGMNTGQGSINFNGGSTPTTSPVDCGACINVSKTLTLQPQQIQTQQIQVAAYPTNPAQNSTSNSSNNMIEQQAQTANEERDRQLANMAQQSKNAKDMSSYAPSAGGKGEADPVTNANDVLRTMGMGAQ